VVSIQLTLLGLPVAGSFRYIPVKNIYIGT